MGDATVTTSNWRNVEVGRVVFFSVGPYAGRIAAIAEIIDHKRILVHGPSSKSELLVPRHAAALSHVQLTPIVIKKLPRAAGNGPLKAAWEKAEVESQWEKGSFATKRAQSQKRRDLTDFERFKVMRLRKQARFEVRKSLAKVKASA